VDWPAADRRGQGAGPGRTTSFHQTLCAAFSATEELSPPPWAPPAVYIRSNPLHPPAWHGTFPDHAKAGTSKRILNDRAWFRSRTDCQSVLQEPISSAAETRTVI